MKNKTYYLLTLVLILSAAIGASMISCGDDDDDNDDNDDNDDGGGVWTCCFAKCNDGELVWISEAGDVTESDETIQSIAQECSDYDGPDVLECLVCETDECTSCSPTWWVEGDDDVNDDVDDDIDDDVNDDVDDDVNDDVDDDVDDDANDDVNDDVNDDTDDDADDDTEA